MADAGVDENHRQSCSRTRLQEYEEPRPDNGIYRFRCITTTTPSTDAGVHRVIDERIIEETVRWPNYEHRRRKERRAIVQQSLDAVTVNFSLHVAGEQCTLGQEPQSHYDEDFTFSYDVSDALRHISGWVDEHAEAEVLPSPPRPLVVLPPPPALINSTRSRSTARTFTPDSPHARHSRLLATPTAPAMSLKATTFETGHQSHARHDPGARVVDVTNTRGSERVSQRVRQNPRRSARLHRVVLRSAQDDDEDGLFVSE